MLVQSLAAIGLIAAPVVAIFGVTMLADDMAANFETGLSGPTGTVGGVALIGGIVAFIASLLVKVLL